MDGRRTSWRSHGWVPAASTFLFLLFFSLPLWAQWTGADVGSVGVAGTDSYNSSTGVYTIQGSGTDIGGASDACHFVYQTLTADGELEARVASIQNTSAAAKAGVMIRQSTAAGAINAFIAITPTSGVVFQRRTALNGTTTSSQTGTPTAPYWVKIVKDNTIITVYQSPDGVNWTYEGLTNLTNLTSPVDIGFAVTSDSNTALCTATFDNITFSAQTSYGPASPWSDQDIGTTGQPGVVHLENSTWSVYGAGTGITGTADSFHYACQALSGNGIVMAQVSGLSPSTTSAGVIMRQDLTAGAAEASVLLNATSGISFGARTTAGASLTTTPGASVVAPYWVKLVRAGNVFNGYESTNGSTWTLVGSQTINMTGTIYVGVGTTSGNTGTMGLGLLDRVAVIPTGNYLVTGDIAAGDNHNLYLQPNGSVWAWGKNANGQVGNGTTTNCKSPVQLTTLTNMEAVSAGIAFSLALQNNGTVWAWGLNSSGQLGDGTTTQETSPEQLTTLSGIVAVSAGATHSLALDNNGNVWAWGLNSNGELGDGTTTQHASPEQITSLSGIVAISAGTDFSLALKNDGTVWAWGKNTTGQLGNGTTTESKSPVELTGISNVIAISAGTSHSLALDEYGDVWAWGDNSTGEIGNGTTTQSNSPVEITGLSGITAIKASDLFSLALQNNGTVWSWGTNTSGELGNNTTTEENSPVQVSGLTGAVAIAAGQSHSAAITSNGAIWTWGSNSNGQLGIGTTTASLVPVALTPVINSAATATGTVGVAFSYTIAAAPLATSFTATGLPPGLSVNTTTGMISGTPTSMGNYSVALSATNISGTGTATLTLTINPPPPVITSPTTATGTKGVAFSYTITATNNPTSFAAMGLPGGLSINTTTGVISGTPTGTPTSTVTLKATNAGGTGTAMLMLTINPPAPVITSTTTATGTQGVAFSYTIRASNSPTSFNATGLPAGLSVNTTTGVISGTPTGSGTSSVTISASNAGGTGTATLSLTINPSPPVITSPTTAAAAKGLAFSYMITATNLPTSFKAPGLPAGLSVNTTTGVISGTPTSSTADKVYSITLSATNAGGTGTATLTLTLNPPSPVISSSTTATGTDGGAFSYSITANNSPTSYNATGLPAGLSINTGTGVISGTPTVTGTFAVTLSATNAQGTNSVILTLTINSPAPVINSATTATGLTGVAFTYTITATNNPTSYGATGLPGGLSINTTTGVISGTLTAAGTSTVTLSASNAGGTGSTTLTLTIITPTLTQISGGGQTVAPNTFVPIPLVVQVTDGSGNPQVSVPVTFAISSGSSGGLTLSSSGSTSTSVSLATDANGKATVHYQTGSTPFQSNTITATAGSGTGSASISFTITTQTNAVIADGEYFTVALKPNGTVWTWGSNTHGQLGNGTTTSSQNPQQVPGLRNIEQISVRRGHVLALRSDNTLWAWGENDQGQIGNGTTADQDTPQQVTLPSGTIQTIAAGGYASFVLMADGTLYGWGGNSEGQLGDGTTNPESTPEQIMAAGTGFTALAAGYNNTVALKNDGTVWITGSNASQQDGSNFTNGLTFVPVAGISDVAAIAVGDAHVVALQANGAVWGWGSDTDGSLGDGQFNVTTPTPQQIGSFTNAVSIYASGGSTFILFNDGSLKDVGENNGGQLGLGNTTNQNQLQQPANLPSLTGLAASHTHTIALTQAGTLVGWGDNSAYELGPTFPVHWPKSAQALDTNNYFAVACGKDFQVFGGTANSFALGVGNNQDGQLGLGNNTSYPTMQLNGPLHNYYISEVFAGAHHAFFTDMATLLASGDNSDGQLGNGTTTNQNTPVAISFSNPNVVSTAIYVGGSVAGGERHSLAVMSDGSVTAWGNNSHGQLGDGTTLGETEPESILGLSNIVQVTAGGDRSFALDSSGNVWAWGENTNGELGLGTTGDVSTPTQVASLPPMQAIATSESFTMALDTSGNIWTWGSNSHGQLGNGSTQNNETPTKIQGLYPMIAIAAGGYHAVAIQNNRSVWTWGANADGQLGNGTFNDSSTPAVVPHISDVKLIGAGENFTSLIKNDGTLEGFGDSSCGQLAANIALYDYTPTTVLGFSITDALPQVSILQPTNGTVVAGNQNLALQASANANGSGSISQVVYYVGGDQVGQSSSPDASNFFDATWTLPAATSYGDYTITAIAYNSDGVATMAAPVSVYLSDDQAGDGVPDWWELEYFGSTGYPSNSSPDGNGLTLLQDYQQNNDPTNYYSQSGQTITPVLAIVSGNNQTGAPGVFAPQPLVVQVADSDGNPLVNAPVTFTVTQGSGEVAATTAGTPTTTLQVTTDNNGQAQVYFQQPNDTNTVSQISAATGGQIAVFTETTDPVPLTGLDLWLRADAGVTTDSSNDVQQWMDQSAAAHLIGQSTQAGPPVLQTDSQGNPTLRFNGNQALYGADQIPANGDVSIVTVEEADNPQNFTMAVSVGGQANAGTTRAYAYRSGQAEFDTYYNSVQAGSAASPGEEAVSTVTYQRSTGNVNFYLRGSPNGSANIGVNDLSNGVVIGNSAAYNAPWTGNISEILVYDHVLSSTEQSQVEGYLADKYGLYSSNATWPSAYSADIEALIAENQWSEAEANAYLASLGESVQTPTVSPPAGRYTSSQTITVTSATSGATIYYTTDGTTPTTSSSSISNGGTLTVSSNTQFNFIAATGDGSTSPAATAIYQIGSNGELLAGDSFTMVLKPDGTIWTWGDDSRGQQGDNQANNSAPFPQEVPGLSGMTSVAAAADHALAVDGSGHVWAWGADDQSQGGDGGMTDLLVPTEISGLSKIASVYAGQYQGFAVDTNGNLYAWGNNSNGQLGDGTTNSQGTPEAITSISNVVKVAPSPGHTLVLKSDGAVWASGSNDNGQLGDGTQNNASLFEQVPGLANVIDIAVGANHSMALLSDGTVWTWGSNSNGQLGNGTTNDSLVPQQVLGLPPAVAICAVDTKSYVILADGTVRCFGGGTEGEMGIGVAQDQWSPVEPTGISNVTQLAAGTYHAVVCTSSGAFYGWGDNTSFRLTQDFSNFYPNTEVHDDAFLGFTSVNSAGLTTVGLKNDGTVWTVGQGALGNLGQGSWSSSERPVQAIGLSNIVKLGTGEAATAIDNQGNLWAWGANGAGQLGVGSYNNINTPTQVLTVQNVVAAAASDYHMLILQSDGSVWASGDDSDEELGDGSTVYKDSPIEVTALNSLIIKGVAACNGGSFALDSNGHVWAWGANSSGQLGLASGPSGDVATPTEIAGLSGVTIVAIDARYGQAVGLDSNGHVWSWGGAGNADGTPVEQPESVLYNVKTVAAGGYQELAIKNDGTLWGWGGGGAGQLGNGSYVYSQSPPAEFNDTQGIPLHGVVVASGTAGTTVLAKEDGSISGYGLCDLGYLAAGIGVYNYSPKPIFNFAMTETPPSVSISSPITGSTNTLGTALDLQASASASTGSITEVDYYLEGVKLGSSTAGGNWDFSWTPTTYGDFTLYAVAYDSQGVSQISTPVTINVPYDSDGNGLPDWWELDYFGRLGNNPNTTEDYGHTNLTLLQLYQDRFTLPSGIYANISIVSGNNQTSQSDNYPPGPFVVEVTDYYGRPLYNAPVHFFMGDEDGSIYLLDNSENLLWGNDEGPPLYTDTNGLISVWPLVSGSGALTMEAFITTPSPQSSVTFTVNVQNPSSVPSAVTGVSAQIASASEIDMAWTNTSTDATSNLVQQQNSDGSWTTITTLSPFATTYQATGLTSGNTYNYQVVASNYYGQAAAALPSPITLGPPVAPTNLTAVAGDGDGAIDLAWTNNANNASSLQVLEQTSSGSWSPVATLPPDATTYQVTGLPVGAAPLPFEIMAVGALGQVAGNPVNPPAPVSNPSYILLDLGANMTPIKITNTGYVLMQDNKGNYYVWNNGSSGEALQPSSAGDVINATDIGEDGTVVGDERPASATSSFGTQIDTWKLGEVMPKTTPLVAGAAGETTNELIGLHVQPEVDSSGAPLAQQPATGSNDIWSLQKTSSSNQSGFDGFENDSELGNYRYTPGSGGIRTPGPLREYGIFFPDDGTPAQSSGDSRLPLGLNAQETPVILDISFTKGESTPTKTYTCGLHGTQLDFAPVSIGSGMLTNSSGTTSASALLVGTQKTGTTTTPIWWNGSDQTLPAGFTPLSNNRVTVNVGGHLTAASQIVGTYGGSSDYQLLQMNPATGSYQNQVPANLSGLVYAFSSSGWSNLQPPPGNGLLNHFINDEGAIVGTATSSADSSSHGVLIAPFHLVSDLVGAGAITSSNESLDLALEAKALNPTTTDDTNDGTEYLFPDDLFNGNPISHGIWCEGDPNAPAGTAVDDNAKQIQITCPATVGSIWFEYPNDGNVPSDDLVFYPTRACTSETAIPFTTSTPTIALSDLKAWVKSHEGTVNGDQITLYVRLETVLNNEVHGKLVMNLGTADKSQTFGQALMPLDMVPGFGAAHFFQAANRYIMQNNSLHYFRTKNYLSTTILGSMLGSTEPIDIVVRREDSTTIQAVDTYRSTPKLYGIKQVVGQYPKADQIINGNLCSNKMPIYTTADGTTTYPFYMTSQCLGNLISGGALNTYVSTSNSADTYGIEGPTGRYIAMNSPNHFTFARGIVPATSGYQEALGGLYNTTSTQPHYDTSMIGEAPVDSQHKVLFTLTYQNPSDGDVSSNMVSDAAASGCPPLPPSVGGISGEITLFWNDGGTSIALALKDPSFTSPPQVLVAGLKHTLPGGILTIKGYSYCINTYLIFNSTKPRQ